MYALLAEARHRDKSKGMCNVAPSAYLNALVLAASAAAPRAFFLSEAHSHLVDQVID